MKKTASAGFDPRSYFLVDSSYRPSQVRSAVCGFLAEKTRTWLTKNCTWLEIADLAYFKAIELQWKEHRINQSRCAGLCVEKPPHQNTGVCGVHDACNSVLSPERPSVGPLLCLLWQECSFCVMHYAQWLSLSLPVAQCEFTRVKSQLPHALVVQLIQALAIQLHNHVGFHAS